jgi:alpha-galactosidase
VELLDLLRSRHSSLLFDSLAEGGVGRDPGVGIDCEQMNESVVSQKNDSRKREKRKKLTRIGDAVVTVGEDFRPRLSKIERCQSRSVLAVVTGAVVN